ncbi:MAG: PadR family transcriptional regulator [Anaerolineae bacterium]|jgi:DNA-binding PadR family transcriptional regulator
MSVCRDLFLGFVRLYILHHAGREPVYGLWLMEELAHHGHELSAGTIYPMLHSLQEEGLLVDEKQVVGGKVRRYYRLTDAGQEALDRGREKALELLDEIREESVGW